MNQLFETKSRTFGSLNQSFHFFIRHTKKLITFFVARRMIFGFTIIHLVLLAGSTPAANKIFCMNFYSFYIETCRLSTLRRSFNWKFLIKIIFAILVIC